jgi:hypothetical protein
MVKPALLTWTSSEGQGTSPCPWRSNVSGDHGDAAACLGWMTTTGS